MDFTYLEEFAAGDEAMVVEVLTIFREQIGEWPAALRGTQDTRRTALHTIKGAARGIGATALADAAERAEVGGENALPALFEALDASAAAIEGYLTRIGGG